MIPENELLFLRESNLIEGEPADGEALEDAVAAWLSVRDLSLLYQTDVLRCHADLMRSRKSIGEECKGVWSPSRTRVGFRVNPEPKSIPGLVSEWLDDINSDCVRSSMEKRQRELNEWASTDFHVRFERIHPFLDGNGRTGRIFWNWHRLRLGLPTVTVLNAEKRQYYRMFR